MIGPGRAACPGVKDEAGIRNEDISLVVHDASESAVIQPETQVHSRAAEDVSA